MNNKSEILAFEYCGCFNCLDISKSLEIREWIDEPNGGEPTAACPKCTFDVVLSGKYPIADSEFLLKMRSFHFGS